MSYLDEVEFVDNPDPRCPCILLLDTSQSMNGQPIIELNKGLQAFQADISRDIMAQRRVEVALITFGKDGVVTQRDFITTGKFHAPILTAGGTTPMGAAIHRAFDMLRARKDQYKASGIAYYRPWIFLVTDGQPTDDWQSAAQLVHDEEQNKGVAFFAVGVEQANMQTLAQIAVRAPLHLQGLNFVDMFLWLSQSQQRVSNSRIGQQTPLPPAGWAAV